MTDVNGATGTKYAPPPDMEADVYENSVLFGLTEHVYDLPEPEEGRYGREVPARNGEPYGYDRARHRYLARTKREAVSGLSQREEEELRDLSERAVWANAWRAGTARRDSPGAPPWERPFSGGNREL